MGKILKVAIPIGLLLIPGLGTALTALIGATLTSVVGTVVLGAALSGVAQLIVGTQKSPQIEDTGQRLNLTVNPAAPREICYGKAATGGNLIFRDTVGSNNSDLWMVTVLAGHEIESLEEVKFGGKVVTFSGNQAVGEFAGKWFQFVHLGTDTQTADADLVAASTKWTTNHRLRGVAYVVNRFIFDQDIFPKGLEQVVYTIKGKKLYDPRLDSTQGGSGLHRFANKSTWAFSENSALCDIDYQRGETQNSKLIWGMGQVETAFDWPSNIAEANICEEQITLKAGGTEDRYTCNGFLNSSDKHETNIRAILSSCAGNLVWQSGKWRIYVGAARTAIKTRIESQFIGPVKYIPKKDYQKRSNAIRGLYNDPDAGYEAKDYPPVINSTFVTEDGGQELWGDLNLPMTKSKATAQRLANIALRQARMEKIFSGTLNTIGFEDQAQDSVNLTYSRFNLSNQKMIISDWALRFQQDENNNVGLVVEETFIETDDNIYAWTAATDEATIPAVVGLLNPPPVLLAWDDVNTRPAELTDGRILAGLEASGDLNRNITSARANSSNVLRRTTGGLFSGALDSTLGATWGTNVSSRPVELTDGRVSAGLEDSGDLNRNITSARANSSNVLRRTTGGLYAGNLDATRQFNRGAFVGATTYALGDLVTDAGSSFEYINATPSSGNLTTNGTFWKLLAAKGDTGSQGTTGDTGLTGDTGTTGTPGTDGTDGAAGAAGTDGNFKDLKFKASDALPATPTGDNPVGWTDTIPATGTRWQSVATKTFGGNLIGSWSTPALFGGVYRGTWSSVATYNLGDSVSHTGRTFILTVTSSVNNIPPTSNTSDAFWDLLSAKGDSGDPPVAFTDTATHSNGTVLNMRTLANGLGYDGVSDATFTVTVSANITANPGTVDAITTGTWPTGPTIALTLIVNTGIVIRGGGGNGGNGGDLVSGAAGGRGGDGINLAKDLTITLNGTSTVSGGSGGGGGGAGFFQISPEQEGTGGGGGGGFPNGLGGTAPAGAVGGQNGTTTSGGTGGAGFNGGGSGGNGGGVSGITPSNGDLGGGSASASGGARGFKGDGVKQNGNVATISGTGTNSGLGA